MLRISSLHLVCFDIPHNNTISPFFELSKSHQALAIRSTALLARVGLSVKQMRNFVCKQPCCSSALQNYYIILPYFLKLSGYFWALLTNLYQILSTLRSGSVHFLGTVLSDYSRPDMAVRSFLSHTVYLPLPASFCLPGSPVTGSSDFPRMY